MNYEVTLLDNSVIKYYFLKTKEIIINVKLLITVIYIL